MTWSNPLVPAPSTDADGDSVTIVSPGDTKVVQFFGRYIGTIRRSGVLMTVPFTTKKKVSVKVRNFETNELKVNDADGNPVNIAAIVVWQVADTTHPYDYAGPGEESLRGSTELVAKELSEEVTARIAMAGLEVVETALERLESNNVVSLDEERKAAMVSNLLVVLTGDSRVTPVVNAGTLYN